MCVAIYCVCVSVCYATLPVKCFSLTGETLKSATTSVPLKQTHTYTQIHTNKPQAYAQKCVYTFITFT